MPDEKLVEELDGVLWRIEGNYHREGAGPGSRFEGQTLQTVQARALVRRICEWLAERGRLVPDGAMVCDEYGTHNGIREHRQVITTRWVPVPDNTEEQTRG